MIFKIKHPRQQKCRRGITFVGCRMDRLAVFQCDASVPQSQRLAVIAHFAAHGIDVAILPPGMELVALTEAPEADDMSDAD